MISNLLLIVLGLVMLYFGAEGLVRGGSSLALRLRVSSLVIGLTVVAYGTSMPEMIVSIKTALSHQGDIALGNVIGSNMFNIALILGLSALISPIKIHHKVWRIDTPLMIATAFLFLLVFRDLYISRLEGVLLIILIILYTGGNFYVSRREGIVLTEEEKEIYGLTQLKNVYIELGFILGGLVLLGGGAKLLVDGAVGLASMLGLSQAVIGLTIVAAGTSLPELATSVVAAMRKEADIAIGNIIGSNIFNILSILGMASAISPIRGEGIRMTDVYVMIGVSVLLWPLMRTGEQIKRWEGVLLLVIYVGYIFYLLFQGGSLFTVTCVDV